MASIRAAIDRIKILECPTGELENRVAGILQQYEIANKNQITVKRDKDHDENGSQAYLATISGTNKEEIIILAEAGMDDYVVKIVDARLNC